MSFFKEKHRKVDIYFHVEEKLENKNLELEDVEIKLENKKAELEELNEKISLKKAELQSLKTEVIELKDFVNQNFMEEFKKYDYKVDITNCYIVGLHGKRYIAFKQHSVIRSDWYTLATGEYNVEIYRYYDVLNIKDHKCKYLYEYRYGHDDNNYFPSKLIGQAPEYEEHILKVYPELSVFADNKVPNTYLKKIYYEVNDLGNNKLIKSKPGQIN